MLKVIEFFLWAFAGLIVLGQKRAPRKVEYALVWMCLMILILGR